MDRPRFVYDRHNADSLYHETWTLKRARHEVGIIEPLVPRFYIRCRYRKPRVADKFHDKNSTLQVEGRCIGGINRDC